MKTTRATATRRVTDGRLYLMAVFGPDGKLVKVVECQNKHEAMDVLETEALDAPVWTMLFLARSNKRGYEVVDRWAVGPHGLSRAPRRRTR